MNTSLKSSCKTIFHPTGVGQGKNGLHTSPTNDDLPSAYTWGTPKISRCTGRDAHHDA
jgi:hypothetical protein